MADQGLAKRFYEVVQADLGNISKDLIGEGPTKKTMQMIGSRSDQTKTMPDFSSLRDAVAVGWARKYFQKEAQGEFQWAEVPNPEVYADIVPNQITYYREFFYLDLVFGSGNVAAIDNRNYPERANSERWSKHSYFPQKIELIVEHENEQSDAYCKEELGKFTYFRAPLKVLICYGLGEAAIKNCSDFYRMFNPAPEEETLILCFWPKNYSPEVVLKAWVWDTAKFSPLD